MAGSPRGTWYAARGKPKGAHHRTTVFAEKLLDMDAGQIIKQL